MTHRFKVVPKSQSAHCCFEATVVDTSKPIMIGGAHYNDQFEAVCECFEPAQAERIAAGLNAAATGDEALLNLQPTAWVDGAALRWLADPERSSDAYIETSLNVSNPEGVRTALYTAPVVAAADRVLLQQALEALELSIPLGSDLVAKTELAKAAIRARLETGVEETHV